MSPVATPVRLPDRRQLFGAGALQGGPGTRLFEPAGSTLEDLVLGAWEDLEANGRTRCPICRDGELEARGCSACGSELS